MAKSRDLFKGTDETFRINPDNYCDVSRMQPKSHNNCNNNMFHTLKSPDESLPGQFYVSQNIENTPGQHSTTLLEPVSYSQSLFNEFSSRNIPPTHPNEMGFSDSPMNNDWCQLTMVKKENPKIVNIKTNQTETHSNLIDLYSPPNSPSIKPENLSFTSEKQSTFHHSSSTSDIVSLTEEFSLLASKEDIATGSVVEVLLNNQWLVGTLRWCGKLLNQSIPHQIIAGIELGEEIEEGTDGSCSGHQYFVCQPGKGIFVPVKYCKKYSVPRSSTSCFSISSPSTRLYETSLEMEYGGPDCPPVTGQVAPIGQSGDVSKLAGKFRGIQGHHNSCYLDATLFSMFTFTSIFDCLLFRPPTRDDIPQYDQVQRILREEIVNPLRQHYFVRADKVMKLRRLLQKLSSVTGLTNEEKDPEEFLHCLLSQTLRAEPFLKLSSGQEAYHHQLFVEKDEKLIMPTVQQLFEQSFLASGIKLKEVPPCLIIQMPRFGKSYKMYPHVLPSSLLDITDVLEDCISLLAIYWKTVPLFNFFYFDSSSPMYHMWTSS